ncbi:ATP-dependent helicase [Lacibacter luteus]|uniref:ATP-dependent helicase n=1 Tax=Lacibacter luteus TaxID=2508719 RepID=A0A4Q1CPM8_9BACT|nr:DEAD/DEAH box helicase [Lacibacter luteus]RXK62681.1 ATP-dependent helicase [Lacibacter luteus]
MDNRNTKTYLLFQPKHLFTKRPVLEIRQLIKTATGITSGEQQLSRANLKQFFPQLSDEGMKTLLGFSKWEWQKTEADIVGQSQYISNETERAAMQKKAMARKLQSMISAMRQLQGFEFYHSGTVNAASTQTVKCVFHSYPVELAFHAVAENDRYKLEIQVVKGKERMPLASFKRFHFLLENDSTYYQLASKSHDAVEWLQQQDSSTWTTAEPSSFEQVVAKLKEWELKVDATAITQGEELIAEPQPQVMLSELNNTFLKLEPRFVYDGYVIDGPFEETATIQSAGKVLNIIRHQQKEEELVTFLRSLHEKFSNQSNGFFYLTFAEAQKKGWFLKVYHKLLEMDVDLLGIDLMKHFRYSPHIAETTISKQETENSWICLGMMVKFGKEIIPLNYLQKSLQNGQKAVMLKDGSLGVLGEDWLKQYGMMIRHGKVRKDELLVPKWLLMSEATDETTEDASAIKTDISAGWFSKWKQWEKQEQALYALPTGLTVKELRPYQQKGYEWLRLLSEIGGSGCLADDMGLGKTLQTITFLLHKIEEQPNDQHLVAAPASLLYNWQKELEKFAPAVKAVVFHGAGRDESLLNDANNKIIITSYGTLRQDIALLQNIPWNTIVVDESQHIKNPSAQITKAVWQLVGKTKIALSGTPVMNGTGDLYSQLHFLLPGLLGSNEFFRREYAIPIEQKADAEKAAALQKLIRPFVLRRTKEQAAPDLPTKTESVLWCEMDIDQRTAYESIKENVRSNVLMDISENGLNKGKMSVLAGLMKLRQICNSCELVKDEDVFAYDSIKTKVLIDELKTIIPQHRALVFSQFTSMLDLLERDLQKEGIKYIRLDGQTKVSERQDLVAEFQDEESDVTVFLLSLKAGNAGLTLTAADYVFLFDPWWNTAVENQAIDRTHRIGQQSHVFAYRMICKDSVEEKIMKLAAGKKKLAEDLITAEEGFVKSLSLDDIKYLLE